MKQIKFKNSEVTFGEILVSIVIFLLFISIGLLISNFIFKSSTKKLNIVASAFKIDKTEENIFKYGMNTNLGNSLVYTEFEAVDTVTLPEISGKYLMIKKTTEKYTKRIVREEYENYRGNKQVRMKEVKEWEIQYTQIFNASKVKFMNVVFDASKFNFSKFNQSLILDGGSASKELTNKVKSNYLYEDSSIFYDVGDYRYSYQIIPMKVVGTIYCSLKDNDVFPVEENKITVYPKTIESYIEIQKTNIIVFQIIFWIIYILVIIVCIIVFANKRNGWLKIWNLQFSNKSIYVINL